MTSRERVLVSLCHREPDRIPFDLGGMAQSGIHSVAYTNLRRHIGLPPVEPALLNVITQCARIDNDLADRLQIDTSLVYGKWACEDNACFHDEGEYREYTDEWRVGRRKPRINGQYFDICSHPCCTDDVEDVWRNYHWPDPLEVSRFDGLREEAKCARESGRFVVLMGLCPGIMEMCSWLRGFERFFMDLAMEPKFVARLLGKVAELKIAYWLRALEECGEYIDAINEADDVAAQDSMLMSPQSYRTHIKPFHRDIISAVKLSAPHVKVLFHSCGAIRPIIPDLIEIGVDILNPVQVSALGMDPATLKRDFGRELSFWGGGVDTQRVLEFGTPQQIRDDVRRNIDALAPGGGFIFSTVHIVQPNVPPENYMTMWDEFQSSQKSVLRRTLAPGNEYQAFRHI